MSDAGEIRHDVDFDLTHIVNEMARRIAKERDQRVLDLLEHAYGFVRPVRCRDCKNGIKCDSGISCIGPLVQTWDYYNDEPLVNPVPPDGYCAWGRREG